jgi:hypothetical protein
VIDTTLQDLLAVTRVQFTTKGVSEYRKAAEFTWGFPAWAKAILSPQQV